MKKSLLLILLIPLFLFAKPQSELQKVSLRLLWLNQFEFAGFYTALEKGYYKDLGIDLEIKEYEFGIDITQEVLSGKSDFALESSSLILERMLGKDVFLLMSTYQKSPFVLMSKKREDIQTLQDLRGKKIMVAPNQVTMASLNAMFRINNISYSDFTTLKHSFDTDDLINGTTDAMSTYISNEPFHLKEKGIEYTIFDPAEYGFSFYSDILFCSKSFYEKNPQLVENFYKATLKGWEYSFENIDETAALIYDKYNTQNKTLEHLLFEANELKKLAYVEGVEFGKFKYDIITQIAQTYQLLNLSNSTITLDGFIYEKALHVEKKIDYILLFKISLGAILVLVGLYYWNRKLSKLNTTIALSSKKISTLLDNAGQGFLTFDLNFKIDKEYSKECIKLFKEDIAQKDISELLFDTKKKREFFKNAITLIVAEQNPIKRKSLISLLPHTIILNKKAIKVEYKVLQEEQIMLILTNITAQKRLEKKIQKEQEILKMTVAIVSDNHIFYDTTKEYKEFLQTLDKQIDPAKPPKENLEHLYRAIHTFKGSFSQLYMQDTVMFLHSVEDALSALAFEKNIDNELIKRVFFDFDFEKNHKQTMQIIETILGEEFIESHNFLKIELSSIKSLEEKISKALSDHQQSPVVCRNILLEIQNLSNQKLYDLLKPYTHYTSTLAQRLQKEIYPFEIQGDRELSVPNEFKGFLKSLIHLFRNCIDHGIETPEERVVKNKDEKGLIVCEYRLEGENLHLEIADDGRGIDTQTLLDKLQERGYDTHSFSSKELLDTIFIQNLSTKESITDVSGRGVGMSAIKEELDALGGSVDIESRLDEGTTFKFIIPTKRR